MRPTIVLGLLFGIALGGSALGCRDSNPAGPQETLDNLPASPGSTGGDEAPSDSGSTPSPPSTTHPADPDPARPDTTIPNPPPLPSSFTLRGVTLGAVTSDDTTQTVRLAGATATLVRVKAADGAVVPEAVAGSAVSNANGEFRFEGVASAYYRLDVKAPPGSPYADDSRIIAPPWSAEIGVYVVLLRKS